MDLIQCPVRDPAVATQHARIWPHLHTHTHTHRNTWLMGSEVNPASLSQVSLFGLILEGSGEVVPGKLMVPAGTREVKQVAHREMTCRVSLCLAFLSLPLSLSVSLSLCVSLSYTHTHTHTHTYTHTGTKRNHFQLSVTLRVYLDNFGILSNFNP